MKRKGNSLPKKTAQSRAVGIWECGGSWDWLKKGLWEGRGFKRLHLAGQQSFITGYRKWYDGAFFFGLPSYFCALSLFLARPLEKATISFWGLGSCVYLCAHMYVWTRPVRPLFQDKVVIFSLFVPLSYYSPTPKSRVGGGRRERPGMSALLPLSTTDSPHGASSLLISFRFILSLSLRHALAPPSPIPRLVFCSAAARSTPRVSG